jgi:hypothetical protein
MMAIQTGSGPSPTRKKRSRDSEKVASPLS